PRVGEYVPRVGGRVRTRPRPQGAPQSRRPWAPEYNPFGVKNHSPEQLGWLDAGLPLLVLLEPERRRLELADDLDVRLLGDLPLQPGRPEAAVDDQPPGALERRVLRRPHRRREHP